VTTGADSDWIGFAGSLKDVGDNAYDFGKKAYDKFVRKNPVSLLSLGWSFIGTAITSYSFLNDYMPHHSSFVDNMLETIANDPELQELVRTSDAGYYIPLKK